MTSPLSLSPPRSPECVTFSCIVRSRVSKKPPWAARSTTTRMTTTDVTRRQFSREDDVCGDGVPGPSSDPRNSHPVAPTTRRRRKMGFPPLPRGGEKNDERRMIRNLGTMPGHIVRDVAFATTRRSRSMGPGRADLGGGGNKEKELPKRRGGSVLGIRSLSLSTAASISYDAMHGGPLVAYGEGGIALAGARGRSLVGP